MGYPYLYNKICLKSSLKKCINSIEIILFIIWYSHHTHIHYVNQSQKHSIVTFHFNNGNKYTYNRLSFHSSLTLFLSSKWWNYDLSQPFAFFLKILKKTTGVFVRRDVRSFSMSSLLMGVPPPAGGKVLSAILTPTDRPQGLLHSVPKPPPELAGSCLKQAGFFFSSHYILF